MILGLFFWIMFGGFNVGLTAHSTYGLASGRLTEPLLLFVSGPVGTAMIIGWVVSKN